MTEQVSEPVVYETTTPAGIEVRFTPEQEVDGKKIKRKYDLRYAPSFVGSCNAGYDHCAKCDCSGKEWAEVPSVSEVQKVLDKPGLPWWGMKVGIEGVLELHRRGILREHTLATPNMGQRALGTWKTEPNQTAQFEAADVDRIVAHLTAEKLDVTKVRDKAGDRGKAVHDAFELWAKEGVVPDPEFFPSEERGYIVGLNAFLDDVQPEPLDSEVMIGSVRHGYAGRYDLRLHVPRECEVVYKRTPKRGAHYAILKPGIILGDLKTSSGVYPSHSRQLEAYEAASVECGYEPTDARGIIHVGKDGSYEFVRSTATIEDFLCVLEVWRSDQAMKARRKK